MNTDPLLAIPEPAAPPRRNGELVFEEPWHSRVFGITMGLCEQGQIRFEDFQRLLVDEIAAWERRSPVVEQAYWACWLAALEKELAGLGLLGMREINVRSVETARSLAHEGPHRH